MRSRGLRGLLLAGLCAWVTAVIVIAITRAADGRPRLSDLVSTPDLILHLHLWTLLTSALPVSGYPVGEIPGVVAAIYAVWRISGIAAVWLAGLAAHVGCTLVVYAGIGGLWLVDKGAAEPYTDRRDYGISAIWLGELGFLTAALWPRNRRAAIGVGSASLAVSVGLLPVAGPMVTAEHLLALIIGFVLPKTFPAALRLA